MREPIQDEAKFQGFGVGTTVKGANLIMVVVLLAFGLVSLYFQARDHQRLETMIHEQTMATRESVREQQISNWLLSLPADRRPELNMPWHLWERLKNKDENFRR